MCLLTLSNSEDLCILIYLWSWVMFSHYLNIEKIACPDFQTSSYSLVVENPESAFKLLKMVYPKNNNFMLSSENLLKR